MKRIVFGESVQGASHLRSNIECQDSFKRIECDSGTVILAVADGHGGKSSPFSKTGSQIAVNVFCKVIEELYYGYEDNLEMLLTYLNREGDTKVAQAIDSLWKKRIWKNHLNKKRKVIDIETGDKNKQLVYKQYGTTLVGLLITPLFLFAFQIGDGDIIHVNNNGCDTILATEKMLGNETYSLCRAKAWEKSITIVKRIDENFLLPSMFLLSTDGFANSHRSKHEFEKSCKEYFEMIKEHGTDAIIANLKVWLSETSEMGCGDDITTLFAYYSKESG